MHRNARSKRHEKRALTLQRWPDVSGLQYSREWLETVFSAKRPKEQQKSIGICLRAESPLAVIFWHRLSGGRDFLMCIATFSEVSVNFQWSFSEVSVENQWLKLHWNFRKLWWRGSIEDSPTTRIIGRVNVEVYIRSTHVTRNSL